jgi:hypothetical protein
LSCIQPWKQRPRAAKRKARNYTRFATMRTVLFLIAGKLNLARIT